MTEKDKEYTFGHSTIVKSEEWNPDLVFELLTTYYKMIMALHPDLAPQDIHWVIVPPQSGLDVDPLGALGSLGWKIKRKMSQLSENHRKYILEYQEKIKEEVTL